MKKKIIYCIISIGALLLSLLIALPFFIESDKIKQEIIQRIEACYLLDASVQDVDVSFYPLPQIKLTNVQITDAGFDVSIPEVLVYPSWEILLAKPQIGRITLINPQLSLTRDPIQTLHKQSDEQSFTLPDSLPGVTISIVDGHLSFVDIQTSLGMIPHGSMTNIDSTLTIKDDHLKLDWQSKPYHGEKINIEGVISLKDFSSHGSILFSRLDLAEIFKASPQSPFAFITDTSEITASFNYSQENGLALNLTGNIPDFSLTGPDLGAKPPVPIRFGEGTVQVKLRENFFEIEIADLTIFEPAAQLQGTCRYYLPENKTEKQIKLDLQAQNIDVTSLRQKLLDLVGRNIVAEIVCEIVQDGEVNTASYYFDNTLEGFEDINNMLINVDIKRTNIHLKYVPIDLQNASGKIRIEDGNLSGWDIITNVGGSRGTNGSFLVGLGHDDWGLIVDVDIDANLPELPKILREIIPNKDVVEELHLLTFTGRNNGHLHIGNDLRDFNINVDVTEFKDIGLRYGRLSWPITPQSGHLTITDKGAKWSQFSFTLGNHIIQETSGQLEWTETTIPFELHSLRGIFDSNTILAEMKSHEQLKLDLESTITSIVGSIQTTGTIKGNFFDPKSYQYNFDTHFRDLNIKSSHFPDVISIDSAHVLVSDKSFEIKATSGIIFGETLAITGKLSHNSWQNMTGDLLVSGEVKQPFMDWLIKKGMIPPKLELKTPAYIQKMRVQWQDRQLLVQGDIEPTSSNTQLGIKIIKNNEQIKGDFTINHHNDAGEVRFTIAPENKKYDLFIGGTIHGEALANIFVDPFIQFDTISGNMQISAHLTGEEKGPQIFFSGDLALERFKLLIDTERSSDHTVNFSISGQDNILSIHQFDINYGQDALLTHGEFKHEGWNGYLHLDMTSPSINTDTVKDITDNINTFIYDRLGITKSSAKQKNKYYLSSEFDFNFEQFIVPLGENKNTKTNETNYQFPITPLHGKYTANSSNSSLTIQDSMVCGLEVEAFLTWFGEKETSKTISVMTPEGTTVELKEFLECFNSNVVIEGPMSFRALASSKKGNIQSAHFSWLSEKGHIYKFAAIAKAISILNIKGWSGSIWEKGFYYNKLEISGTIEDNILQISKLFLDGDGVDIVGKGRFDLDKMEYDMVFYVVPFATINKVITKVPIVGRVLGGKEGRIISVPVKISGPAINPDVSVMDASEIGQATGQWIWDTVTIPFDWSTIPTLDKELDPEEEEPAPTTP